MAQTLDAPTPPATPPTHQAVDHGPRPKSKDGNVRTPKWLYAVMTVGLFFVVLPFVWMVISSFKPEAEVMSIPPTWCMRRSSSPCSTPSRRRPASGR